MSASITKEERLQKFLSLLCILNSSFLLLLHANMQIFVVIIMIGALKFVILVAVMNIDVIVIGDQSRKCPPKHG